MITWIGPIILITAAIVPANPWKMLIAGFIAASMDSLGMVAGKAAGLYEYGAFRNVLLMHYPNYLMLGVAVVISHVVARLGQQVTKEREMGSYRMGELLGRGGMGEVYRATHRMLARPAAIKLIRPEVLASRDDSMAQTATARFRREAEAAARLRSPHTVELYDFGVTEDGTLYLVMELLEGINLELLVRQQGPLAAARVVQILRQVCESLEEALLRPGPPGHQAGEHPPGKARPPRRFREGARLRAGAIHRGAERGVADRRGRDDAGAHPRTWRPRWRTTEPWTGARTSIRWAASPTTCSPVTWSSRARRRSRRF
jgi:hypothetical protein